MKLEKTLFTKSCCTLILFFKGSALCIQGSLDPLPEGLAAVVDIVPGYCGPFCVHSGLEGVNIAVGTGFGLNT